MRLLYLFHQSLLTTATDAEQAINMVAAFARRGHDVELMFPQVPQQDAITADGLRSHHNIEGAFRVTDLATAADRIRPLRRLFHAHAAVHVRRPDDVDLVYTRNIPALVAGLHAGHRVAYDHYRLWPEHVPVSRPLLRWIMNHPRFLAAFLHSDHARQSYLRLGIPASRLVLAHNGYNPSQFAPCSSVEDTRRSVGFPVGASIALYAGHINERKGLDVILRMAERLPSTLFVLVGSERRGSIERKAERRENVRVVPWQPLGALVGYLYAADVLLVPPTLAPLKQHGTTVLPMKLYSYLAAGRPILAPDAEDTRELLQDDVNAVLVPPGDVTSATQALTALLESPKRRARLAEAARQTATGFTWDVRAERIERFLLGRLAECSTAGLAAANSARPGADR